MSWLKALPFLLWLTALLLVGWVLSQLPLQSILETIGTLSPLQWWVWVGLNLGIIGLATQRWKTLVRLLDLRVSFGTLLVIRQAGQAVSFLTPGPQLGGEPLQVFWLYTRCKLPLHSALLALGLDRFYELWINFGVLELAVLLLMASPAAEAGRWQNILLILILLMLLLSGLGWLILKRPEQVLSWLKKVTRYWHQHPRLQSIQTHWQRLGHDLQYAFKDKQSPLFMAFALSVLGWIGLIGELGLLLSFLDLTLDFSGFMLILVALRLAFLLPLPGGIGSLEAALFWAFQSLNLPAEAALNVIALMRLRDALVLLAGFCCLRLLQTR